MDRKAIIGLGIGTFALTMFAEAIYHMVVIGSCAAVALGGGARQCPAGFGVWVPVVVGGVIVALVAFALGGLARSGQVAWTGLFLGGAIACGVALLDGTVRGGEARTAVEIVGAVFVVMALPPLVSGLVQASKWRPVAPPEPASPVTPPPATGLEPAAAPELGDVLGGLQDRPGPSPPPAPKA